MSPSTPSDDDLTSQIQQALSDPARRQRVVDALQNSNNQQPQSSKIFKSLGQIGKGMQGASTPGAALATGLGGAVGLGLGAMLGNKKGATVYPQRTGNNPTQAISPPGSTGEPNLSRPAGPRSEVRMGRDQLGNAIHSNDGGQTWINDDTGEVAAGPAMSGAPVTGQPAAVTGGMKRGGKVRKFASGGEAPEPAKPPVKAVLVRRPKVPVMHTTIVIGLKPKKAPEKKRRGGAIDPPPKQERGLANFSANEPPARYKIGGRVQSPRGSGIARKGKQFRGIF